MFKNLSYKKRFIYLQALILLFLLIGYKMAAKKTFDLRKECKQIEKNMDDLKDAPKQINLLKKKLGNLDNSVQSIFFKQKTVQDILLEQISDYCSKNQILIKDYPKPHIFSKEDYTIETNHIVLEGNYIKLLFLLYHIEQKYRLGKVSSAKFYTMVNNKTKVTELILDLYIQNIKSDDKQI